METVDQWREAAVEELKQIIDDMLYTEKTHLAAAERLQRANRNWGIAVTIASSCAAATIIAKWSPVIAGVFALFSAIVSGVLTFVKPGQLAGSHSSAGRQLGALRVTTRHFLNLDLTRSTFDEVRAAIAKTASEKAAIDDAAPPTSGRAFKIARTKIQAGLFDRDR